MAKGRGPDLIKGEPTRPDAARQVLYDYIRNSEFKRLLGQVSAACAKRDIRSIAVLSTYPAEGRTFFVSVLALGFSQFLRRRVLIMDTVSQSRNESFYVGSVLGGDAGDDGRPESGAIDLVTTRTFARQLRIDYQEGAPPDRAPPPPDPFSFDTADFRIGPFIDNLAPSYDLILLDTCALTKVTKDHIDPIILAKQADASILVTTARSLGKEVLARIQADLSRAEVFLLGTVHNARDDKG